MKLLAPPTAETRPITDRVKESLFSILYKYDMPEGCVVADLFSGTGSTGLEALSRGAKSVTFVEQSSRVMDTLKKNIDKAGFMQKSRPVRTNAFKAGAAVRAGDPLCDLVFVDPPYKMSRDTSPNSLLGRLLITISTQVRPGAIVSVRTDKQTDLLDSYGPLEVIDVRKWGTIKISLLQNTAGTEDE